MAGASPDAFVAKLNPSGSALTYGTFLGGSDDDQGNAILVDSAGQRLPDGRHRIQQLPDHVGRLRHELQWWEPPGDAFVAKLNPAGTR